MPLVAFPLLFVAGAVVGTLGDQIHVQFGVLAYPHPFPGMHGQAFWVPLLFGGAGIAMVAGERAIVPPSLPRTASRVPLVSSFVLFAAAYFSTGLFKDHPLALAAGLSLAWALRFALTPTRDKLVSGLLLAATGSLFEAALSSTGAFYYFPPRVLLVPIWLPALYLHVSLFTREIHLAWLQPAPAAVA